MKYLIFFAFLLAYVRVQSQSASEAIDNPQLTLTERYGVMKSKSQTYGDYKVIKEYILDGFWKISTDSIRSTKVSLQKSRAAVADLEAEVQSLQTALKQKESSMEEIVEASTHISVAGVNVEKALFKVMITMVIIGLLLSLGILTGKLKLMYTAVREKMELINLTHFEFEEYRKKAMERQTRLSRELQTERNKLMELKRG